MIWQDIQAWWRPHNLPAPSVWGKLPYYGDFTHIRTSPQDIQAWQQWFDRYPLRELSRHNAFDFGLRKPNRRTAGWLRTDLPEPQGNAFEQPWCFVLPAGTLLPAPHLPADHAVVGVCAQSCDHIGRLHPVVIWHAVPNEWLKELDQPHHWLYWLGRLLQKHTPPQCRPEDAHSGDKLHEQLEHLWALTRRSLHQIVLRVLRRPLPVQDLAQALDEATSPGKQTTPSRAPSEAGVSQLPWGTWCDRLAQDRGRPHAYFWQQAHNGQYIAAVALDLSAKAEAP